MRLRQFLSAAAVREGDVARLDVRKHSFFARMDAKETVGRLLE